MELVPASDVPKWLSKQARTELLGQTKANFRELREHLRSEYSTATIRAEARRALKELEAAYEEALVLPRSPPLHGSRIGSAPLVFEWTRRDIALGLVMRSLEPSWYLVTVDFSTDPIGDSGPLEEFTGGVVTEALRKFMGR